MKRIDDKMVELWPNEAEVRTMMEHYMDEGHGVYDAAQRAFAQFWFNYPGSEHNEPNDPFNAEFAQYLADGDKRWWCMSDASLRQFLERFTGAFNALEDKGTEPGYEETVTEALRIINP